MPVRNCERCGARMSPWQPRKRIGDDLVCPGCAQKDSNDLRSDRDVAFSLASRKTIHRGGKALAPPKAQVVTANAFEDSQVQWTGNQPPRPQVSYTEFPHYSDGMQFGAHITCNLCGASKRFVSMGPLQSWKEMHADPSKGDWACSKLRTASRRTAGEMDGRRVQERGTFLVGTVIEDRGFGGKMLVRFDNGEERWVDSLDVKAWALGSRQVVAHDSGDGETIYHCPFCGAGQVTGRSDGTAECSFCSTAFTVQVQPQMAATPQTIDGVPHVHPDMPGEPGVPEDPEADFEGTEMDLLPSEEEDQLAATSAYYLTAEGIALDHDAYVRHLAIAHADDRTAVIEQVRAERGR